MITASSRVAAQSLADLETVIERGLQSFIEVGNALIEIREHNLYKEAGYSSFDAYCQARWDFKRAHAYRLMDAAHVAEIVSPIGDISHESQARELAKLKDDDTIIETYRELKQEHGDKLTAQMIRKAVQDHIRRTTYDPPSYTEPPSDPLDVVAFDNWGARALPMDEFQSFKTEEE